MLAKPPLLAAQLDDKFLLAITCPLPNFLAKQE
jgi:hypothetical protein